MLSISSLAASSFAPAVPMRSTAAVQRSTDISMVKSNALPFLEAPPQLDGSMVGDVGFDPLNLSGYYSLNYMREAELKHGRICMLAWFGYVAVDLGLYAPGAPHVSSLAAHDTAVKSGHMLLLLFVLAIPESLSYNAIAQMMSGETDRKPGDYGIGWRFCKPGDERYKLAEITHCRAAMLGFAGTVTQSALGDGLPFPYGAFIPGFDYNPVIN